MDKKATEGRNEYMRAYMAKYREKNKDAVNEYQRKWRKDNPEKVAEYNAKFWEKYAKSLGQEGEK